MPEEPTYDAWLAERQSVEPSNKMADRVMAALESKEVQSVRRLRFAERINASQPARYAACLASMAVGSLPFVFVASYMTQFVRL